MKKIYYLMLCLCIIGTASVSAQVSIGSSEDPQSFSVLELISSSSKTGGLRIPQMTTTERDAMTSSTDFQKEKTGKAVGLTIYNTTSDCMEFWNGNAWVSRCQAVGTGNIQVVGSIPEVPASGGSTGTIQLTTDATDSGNWSFSVKSGEGAKIVNADSANGTFEVEFTENTSEDSRTAVIIVKDAAGFEKEITVIQGEACAKLEITGGITFNLTSMTTAQTLIASVEDMGEGVTYEWSGLPTNMSGSSNTNSLTIRSTVAGTYNMSSLSVKAISGNCESEKVFATGTVQVTNPCLWMICTYVSSSVSKKYELSVGQSVTWSVNSLEEYARGGSYMNGTRDSGFVRFETKNASGRKANLTITCLASGSTNRIWVATKDSCGALSWSSIGNNSNSCHVVGGDYQEITCR